MAVGTGDYIVICCFSEVKTDLCADSKPSNIFSRNTTLLQCLGIVRTKKVGCLTNYAVGNVGGGICT